MVAWRTNPGPTPPNFGWYAYAAYGTTTILDPTATTIRATSAVNNSYLYTGRRLDPEFAATSTDTIYYYRARNYDPNQGRFLGRDPLEYVDRMSLYQYVKGMVLIFVDPFGRNAAQDVQALEKALIILSGVKPISPCHCARLAVVVVAAQQKKKSLSGIIAQINMDAWADATGDISEYAEIAEWVARRVKELSATGEDVSEILRELQKTPEGAKNWDKIEEVFDDINDYIGDGKVDKFLGKLSEIANATSAAASIAEAMDPSRAGDPGRWLKLGGQLGAIAADYTPAGVSEILEFYGEASSGIADALDRISARAGQQNLDNWENQGFDMYKNAWFGSEWGADILGEDNGLVKSMRQACINEKQ